MSEIERKKAETAAKIAALKQRMAAKKANDEAAATPPPPPPPSNGISEIDAQKARAAQKIAELKAKVAAKRAETGGSPANGSFASPPPHPQQSEQARQIAEARAKAQELAGKRGPRPAPTVPARNDTLGPRGGLGIGLHPSLLGDAGAADKSKAGPGGKSNAAKDTQRPEKPKVNPYLIWEDEAKTGESNPAFEPTGRKYAERKSKPLAFSEKGKYMAQANALRQQAKLEEMKRRMAAEARKTEIEEASDKAFLVPAPPEIEWWDEGLLPEGQNSYDNWHDPSRNRIDTDDTIITALIQRPVLLQAPQDKFLPGPKPLMLTTKEQKKLRRQRRMAEMKEEQAKIRLGLVEPPPPKVKKSNMMRVLGEQAVKDPTAVEARVNREIAQRAYDHERTNAERALTQEQKEEKLQRQIAGDEAKGIHVVVFRVDDLSSGKHRYQVDVNAKQDALTGMVILNPTMNLVIVEGGQHSIKHFKKLMLNRVKWTENTPPAGSASTFVGTTDGSISNVATGARGTGSKAAEWCQPLDERGNLKDLSENRCVMVWEGQTPTRAFKRWGSRACETDGEAKDVLSRTKMENMWTLARSK
jgi:U4/U6 small nuclear ribonucleoprotein PRP3